MARSSHELSKKHELAPMGIARKECSEIIVAKFAHDVPVFKPLVVDLKMLLMLD